MALKRGLSVKRINKTLLREAITLYVIYFLIHGFMLLLTGTFHDDWLSYFHDEVTKDMEGYESGRPYYSFVVELVWNLPGYGYRRLAFITYWISYLFTFGTFYHIKEVGHRKAMLITLICMAVPINDARVLLANYPYALGMLFFFAASFFLVKNISRINKLKIRLFVLILFFFSFTLNSNLMLYGMVILYLIIKLKVKKIFTYLDFIILPILFYVLNRKIFPVYGAYADYNLVTIDKVRWAIIAIPEIITETFVSLLRVISKYHAIAWLSSLVTALFFCSRYVVCRKNFLKRDDSLYHEVTEDTTESITSEEKRDSILFIFGLFSLIMGLFSYAVIRQYPNIAITGIQSRDSMQMGLGVAMMVVGAFNKKVRTGIVVFIVSAGFFHFSTWYLNYQTEWYRQLAFQRKVVNIEDVQEGGNFIVTSRPASELDDRRFYTWSGNTAAVTGKRNTFMLNGDKDSSILANQKTMEIILSHYPMYSEYQFDHFTIDGKIDFTAEITKRKTIQIKKYEIFDNEKYENEIASIGTLNYLPLTN